MSDLKKVIQKVMDKTPGGKARPELGKPVSSFSITSHTQESQLESIYYWILDFISDGGWKVEKRIDNFMSSPGSGHFSEMGQRASLMQDRGIKILGDVNTVIKSALNLIYDLKEFEIRLESYENYHSKDKEKRYHGMLSLKQIWIDTVDMKKGNGSINVLSGQAGFVTLRDLFFIVENHEHLKQMSNKKDGIVNEQTSRILTPRLEEFWKWVKYSEDELRKRFNIEKSYLRSQIETIKLYSSWMKPYLKAAEQLRQQGFENNAALVNAFSTSLFELEIFALKEKGEDVPSKFGDYSLERKYHPIVVVNIEYRGHVAQKVTQRGDYGFGVGGRIDITFDSYVLNEEELKLVREELEKNDVGESMQFSGDVAAEALAELQEDLDHFLKDDKAKEAERKKQQGEKKESQDINPFKALFKPFWRNPWKKKSKEIETPEDIKKDNFVEREVRALAAETAAAWLFTVYDIYKKAHGMVTPPEDFDNASESMTSEPSVGFTDIFRGQSGH